MKTENFYNLSIKDQPLFNSTQRVNDLHLLEPVFRQKVIKVIEEARAGGLNLVVFETYRSQQRQAMLYNNGATKLKNVGVHHFGLACDLVRQVDGKVTWEGDYSLLGKLATTARLIWGGDWGKPHLPNNFIDVVHIQRCAVLHQPQLFAQTWYPDEHYDPYQ